VGDERARPPKPAAGREDEILQRVSQVVLAVMRQLSVHDVLQVIVRSARSLVNAKYAAIGVPGDHGSFAEFVVDGIPERQRKAIGPLPRQHGMLGVLLREGQPLRLDDIRADPRFEGGWPPAHPELVDVLGMPIKDGAEVLGVIFAASKRDAGGFTERDEQLLGLFGAHAAIALTNARLYERGRELSVLEERARLARELHDAVSQKLFSVRAKAHAAAVLVSRDPARAVAEMESVAALSGQAHAELRAVIDGLAPPDLSAGGLAGSLRSYAVLAGRTSAAEGALVTRAVQAGAAGFLYKDVDPAALVRAVRSVHDGHTLLAPEAAGAIVGSGAAAHAVRGIGALTRREREILAQLAEGRSNREIARKLLLSEKTVKTHVSSVLAKLGVADRTQAALLAVRQADP